MKSKIKLSWLQTSHGVDWSLYDSQKMRKGHTGAYMTVWNIYFDEKTDYVKPPSTHIG